MKLISFTVPCYNSAEYMNICVDSLLLGGDKVEIIIIDDGSTDDTGKIADEYASKYPNIIKVVHQENGGHGEGINSGLKIATGKYFKVVDSDDWVGEEALKALLEKIESLSDEEAPDLYVCNYVYYRKGIGEGEKISFRHNFPINKICTWDETRKFTISRNITLHSSMYKLDVIKKSGVVLPKYIFFEDNYFVYAPLPYVEKICYMDVDFYYYLVGRDGQSVSVESVKKRHSHQNTVTKLVFSLYDLDEVKKKSKKLYSCMYHHVRLMFFLSLLFTRISGKEFEHEIKQLWEDARAVNPKLRNKIRHRSLAAFLSLPGAFGRAVCRFIYWLSHKVVHFN